MNTLPSVPPSQHRRMIVESEPMTNANTLADRVEGVEGPGRGPILDAFYYIHPRSYSNQPGYGDWFYMHEAFVQKLDAGAYLDAAATLVPDGFEWDLCSYGKACVYTANIDLKNLRQFDEWSKVYQEFEVEAATPALALVAAALRARNRSNTDV